MSKRYSFLAVTLIVTATCALALSSHATDTVLNNDTWQNGTRSSPAAPFYADNNGSAVVNNDGSSYPDSAWFTSNTADLTNQAPGDLRATIPTSSLSTYTYFTGTNTATGTDTPVNLANIGDELKLTWVFTPNGTVTQNGSQGLQLALAQSPVRNTADGSVPSANYTNGLAMLINFAPTFARSNPMELAKWSVAGAGALLGTTGNYAALTNAGTSGNAGFVSGTQYTFVFDLTLTAGGLQVVSTMSGGSINGTGSLTDTYVDPSITNASYDTFDVRASGSATGAAQIDSSLFKVELITVPEPSTVMLVGAGLTLMFGLVHRRRS